MSKLSTERLELRVRALGDADGLFALYSDPDVAKYIGGVMPDRDQAVKLVFGSDTSWRKNGYGFWSIFLKKTGEIIGSCGLRKLPTGEVELVYHLAKAQWKKGFATEATQAVLKYAFELHKLEKLIGLVHKDNAGSAKVLTKLGFTEEKNPHPDPKDVLYYAKKRPT